MDKPKITKRGWNVTVVGDDEDISRNEVLKKANESVDSQKIVDKASEDSFPASDPPASNVFD